MRKPFLAVALASAIIGVVPVTAMHAQDQTRPQEPARPQEPGRDQSVAIVDPVEYQAYENANSQAGSAARAAALESFLNTYPRSAAAKTVLDSLEDVYQGMADQAMTAARAAKTADAQAKAVSDAGQATAKELDAASRLMKFDPDNLKALVISVAITKSQATKSDPPDAKAVAAAAEQALRGLKVTKPQGTSDADWQRLTDLAYPIFHSAVGLDAAISKHFDVAVDEYKAELKLSPPDATKAGTGLVDTLHLADAFAAGSPRDEVSAIWFYARAWNFAPTGPKNYKAEIEQHLKYWYDNYHGGMDGLEGVEKQAAASVFPPGDFSIPPAPTLQQKLAKYAQTPPDQLSLADKETILAHAFKEDADRVWASLKDQPTPVPGTLIAADASAMKVTVTEQGATPKLLKTTSYLVKLTTPMTCKDASAVDGGVKGQVDFLLNNGFKEDTDQLAKLFGENAGRIRKIVLDPTVATIKVAVTDDAKRARTPDFIVNLKEPVACRALPAAGAEFGSQPAVELDGTYDSYSQVAAAGSSDQADQSVQIVLRDGFVQPEKKKAAARRPVTPVLKSSHT